MTELILIRHGETDWNRELRFQGQVDVPLNEIGREQARRVAERLAGEPIHRIYSSDLIRARQTALPTVQRSAVGEVADAGLREQNFGRIDGLRVAEIQARYPEDWRQWLLFDADHAFADGGESTRRFHARVIDAIARIVAAHEEQTLLVVTHGGVLDMVYRNALGLELDGPRRALVPNGAVCRVRAEQGRFEILGWADARHLDGMPAQPVYDRTHIATAPAPLVDQPVPFNTPKPA